MSGGIFLIDKHKKLIEMSETAFDAEDDFQKLLADHPSLLAGDQISPASPRRWLLVAREVGIPGEQGGSDRWSLDHLFLDQDGVPTFVEVKRSSDTRIRREVVGQMMDYAANAAAHWPGDKLEGLFRDFHKKAGKDPDELLVQHFGPDAPIEEFWQDAADKLQNGRLRLIFVGDRIPSELRRIVEFLNDQMERTEVLAVELRRYTADDVTTLVPRVIGITEKTRGTKGRLPPRDQPWDRDSFLEKLQESGVQGDAETAGKILDWAQSRDLGIIGGRGARMAGLSLAVDGLKLFSVDEWEGIGRFRVSVYLLPAPFDRDPKRAELLERLNQIPGVELPPDTQYQGFALGLLRNDEHLQSLLGTLDWLLEELPERQSEHDEPG